MGSATDQLSGSQRQRGQLTDQLLPSIRKIVVAAMPEPSAPAMFMEGPEPDVEHLESQYGSEFGSAHRKSASGSSDTKPLRTSDSATFVSLHQVHTRQLL